MLKLSIPEPWKNLRLALPNRPSVSGLSVEILNLGRPFLRWVPVSAGLRPWRTQFADGEWISAI